MDATKAIPKPEGRHDGDPQIKEKEMLK